ncbi:MAG: MarR family winged helix-turn-helix transcriptional regulator [Alphaproteobacteria bacterium]|nr:MarR family winged helix-turn-helix transcriptional regulator [Alphaproteobacteria bacterium]
MSGPGRKDGGGPSKQRLRLWVNLLRTTRLIEADLREEMRTAYRTTLPRFDVLSALERHAGGLLMGELSRHLMVSNGNVTGIVERLVADGLVERLPVEGDRRAILVRLTPTGAAAFAAMAAEHEDWVDRRLAAIGHDEAQTVIDTLSSIREERP